MSDIIKNLYDREAYPSFPFIKQRRLIELNWLIPRLSGRGQSLLDIGCGDGALLNCLYHLTDINLQGCDFAPKLMQGVNPKIPTFLYDCRNPTTLPDTDIAVIAGVFPYLFQDDEIRKLLHKVSAPLIFVRSPCGNDERIDSYSEALSSHYRSRYRSRKQVESLLLEFRGSVVSERIYPDEIESKFGTKQWYFIASNK